MVKVLSMTSLGLLLIARMAVADVTDARIFHSCGDQGCQARQVDIYEKSDVDAKIGEARGAVSSLETRLQELSRRVDAQQREIDELKKKRNQR